MSNESLTHSSETAARASRWRRLPRWFRISLISIGSLLTVFLVSVALVWWYLHPTVVRTDGVVYGQRLGQPLTMDIIQPSNANGLGVAFMVSGGWKSMAAGESPTWMLAPLLRRGYTVFAVCHVSQPEATVQAIIEDAHRSIRFIRHHAEQYGIQASRLGVSGGSAGGHLSLMLATRGDAGTADAPDPVDRESSRVQAVAVFYPPTDLLNLGDSTENRGDGGPPKSFVQSFGPDAADLEKWKQIGHACSPIYHINASLPPTLIYHGDADTLVTLDQSTRFRDEADKAGARVKVVVHPGGGHGWPSMLLDAIQFATWFDTHLLNRGS